MQELVSRPIISGILNQSVNQSINISLLPRVKQNMYAHGMRHGTESIRDHTHNHNNVNRLTLYIIL